MHDLAYLGPSWRSSTFVDIVASTWHAEGSNHGTLVDIHLLLLLWEASYAPVSTALQEWLLCLGYSQVGAAAWLARFFLLLLLHCGIQGDMLL